MKRCWHYVPASSWFLFEVNSLFGLHFLFVSLFSFPFWSSSCPPVSFSPNLDELFHPIGNHKKSKSPVGFQYFGIIRRLFAPFLKNFTSTNKKFLEKIFYREIQKKKILRKRKAGKPSYRKASLIEAGSLINLRSFKTIFPFFHFFSWEVITEFSNFLCIKRHHGRHMHDTHLDMRGLCL